MSRITSDAYDTSLLEQLLKQSDRSQRAVEETKLKNLNEKQPMTELEREYKWRRFSMHIDMFKFYLEGVLQLLGFYYAITGGIVSYIFAQQDVSITKWALLLPILLSIGITTFFFIGLRMLKKSSTEIELLRVQLSLPSAPKITLLSTLLVISITILSITALALIVAIRLI